jgi:DNA recombination protein RmuC
MEKWQIAGLVVTLLIFCLGGVIIWLMIELRTRLEDQLKNQESQRLNLEELLRDQEREHKRGLTETRESLAEKLANNSQQQLKATNDFQQNMLARFPNLYQALERRVGEMQTVLTETLSKGQIGQQDKLVEMKETLQATLTKQRENFDLHQLEAMKTQQEIVQSGMTDVRKQIHEMLAQNTKDLSKRVDALTDSTDKRLKEISGQVEKRLNEGFEKTTETFNQVLLHLTRIDEAQKKITELSSNVVSLQEVLADKRSRGAFGEVQLNALIRNVMPDSGFSLQHTLSNDTRVDCMLFLPEPTGNIAIDAKFPLESFRSMSDDSQTEAKRKRAATQFGKDIRKHIDDIAKKYIIPGETSDGAVMFIPAEAVFAEIHAHYPDLVEEAFRQRVWLVSPTTMMAILTTARAVLKDAATREQVHVIQHHLGELSKDFGRFQKRMDNLATHIKQAHEDVGQVNISARKISGRFDKIEKVELEQSSDVDVPIFSESEALPADG